MARSQGCDVRAEDAVHEARRATILNRGDTDMVLRLRGHQYSDAFSALLKTAALFVLLSTPAASQSNASKPVDLADGPAKPGFDITRFRNAGNGTFQTLYVTKTEPLRGALKERRVAEDTRVLVTETAAGYLALIMDQMAFHHMAEGRAGNQDWLATF